MAHTATGSGPLSGAEHEGKGIGDWSGWAYFPGIAFIIIGVLAIMQPLLASVATGLYLGAMISVAGAFALVGSLANIKMHGAWLTALLGLLSLVAGGIILYNPVAGAVSLVWVMGAWLIVGGIFELAMAFTARFGRGWLFLIGLLDLTLGTIVFLSNPAEAFVMLGYYVGFSFVYRGIWCLVFASDIRRLAKLADRVGL